MIDAYIRPFIDPPLTRIGVLVAKTKISANTVTLIGFIFGLTAMLSIALGYPALGGFFFILNRISDGLDGGVARATKMSDLGGYLDIMSDFIIYPGLPLAFCFYDPTFILPAAFLIFAMAGAMTSFLAYAVLCAKITLPTMPEVKNHSTTLEVFAKASRRSFFLALCAFFHSLFLR